MDTEMPELSGGGNHFTNEGNYQIVAGERVERGRYFADTRPVKVSVGMEEWESQYKLKPESMLAKASDDLPDVYTDKGEIVRLWLLKEDPKGVYAKMIHDKIVDLLERNTPAEEIDQQLRGYLTDVQEAMEQKLPQISSNT